jgi:hypothetical protein
MTTFPVVTTPCVGVEVGVEVGVYVAVGGIVVPVGD